MFLLDSLKQDLALEFCKNQNKDFIILTETHINHDQIRRIRNSWLSPITFSPGDSHTKGLLVLLHSDLECATGIDIDPKLRFVFFKVTPSNDRVLYVYTDSGHNTRKQLTKGYFFEGLQNYMEIKLSEIKIK